MKKVMKLMMMAMAAIVLSVGFSSCSSDDNDNKSEDTQQAYGEMNLNFTISEDALSVADFTVTYLDENGAEKSELITNTKFSKDIKFKSLPARAKYTITTAIKTTLPDKEKFDISIADNSTIGKVEGTTYDSCNLHKTSISGTGIKRTDIIGYITRACKDWGNDVTINK